MLHTVKLDQPACLSKLHPVCVHVCSTFSLPATQASLPKGHQTYLPLRMFDYQALDQHACLKPSGYVCNCFTRLAGMLQNSRFKLALNQQACLLQLHPTTGTSVTIKIDQHVCLLELHLPADMFESVAID